MSSITQLNIHTPVVSAVEAVKAVQRIPEGVHATFFGKYELWIYNAVLDNKLCTVCLNHEKAPRYFGTELRATFPYLEIVDENTILANVHPNCRCTLNRVTEWTADDIKWFLEYAGT